MSQSISNALRFINAYNQIEQALKAQNNLKNNLSYTETIRIASRTNSIVRKYEDDLIDFGRLRNSIVHSTNENHVIAEPHDDVVDEYEKIMHIICTPPLAMNTVCVKEVQCVDSKTTLREVLILMHKTRFSNLPVYNNKGMLVGVANSGKLAYYLGQKLYNKEELDDVLSTEIGNIVQISAQDSFYAIIDDKVTLDKVLNLFAENRKLTVIIITKNGNLLEYPEGIITVSDILDINKILDNYQ